MKTLLTSLLIFSITFTMLAQERTIDERIILTEISTDKAYGTKPKTNIKVGSISNEYAFIAQLTGPNGEEITARRLGSGWPVKSKSSPFGKAMLDKWEITYEGLSEPIFLYLNGYDYQKPKCPMGLGFKKL
ncbi:MAG TPA: hypothetical protein PLV21_08720 [Cyclobacteriaceae bacterium]|nr:hypothetical protein [Cyclobacteriaceae bacterium]HRJ81953.1 hypothetical protein [Cyclobacteriaceae bacterium]